MENKSHALLAGIFTIVLLVVAILLALWFNRDRIERVPYEIATKLSVPGLNPQAAVRYRGLDVGKVDAITFDPRVPGQILIQLSVNPDTPITQSTYGTLGYQGVTGIAYVQLDDDGSRPVKLRSASDHLARIAMRPSLFDNLQNRGLAILEQTEKLTVQFNNLMEPANQKLILGAFDEVGKAATEIQTIPRQLQPTLTKLPAVTAQAQQALVSLTKLSKDISTLSANVNTLASKLQSENGAFARISDAADRVGSAADKVELAATPLAGDARSTLRTLNRTLDNFSAHPQSLIFGQPGAAPGPGEQGFVAPAVK